MRTISYKSNGFTLIELLIYVAIFAVIAGLTTGVLLTVTKVNQRESSSAEVNGQLNFVMQRIQQLVKDSSNIEISAGITTSTLKLRMKDSAKDPACLYLVNGVIKLAEGPDIANPNNCVSTVSDLTSNRVIVDVLNFKKITQYPGRDTLSVDLQITYNSSSVESMVQRGLQSVIVRVSAATFDSDVVPGGTYNFNLGQTGAPWQKIIMADGSANSPSYTFSNGTGLGLFRAGADVLGFATAGLERIRIDASGRVGVGTTNPSSALHANTASGDTILTLSSTGATNAYTRYVRTGNSGWAVGRNNNGSRFQISYESNDTPTFGTNDFLTILSNGNVGIGTTDPDVKLEVNGEVMINNGGSANQAVCWKSDAKTLGYCSSAVAADGSCTCN